MSDFYDREGYIRDIMNSELEAGARLDLVDTLAEQLVETKKEIADWKNAVKHRRKASKDKTIRYETNFYKQWMGRRTLCFAR